MGLDLYRQPFRHVDHGELARRVWAESNHALQTGHRRSVDDVPAFAVRTYVWEKSSNAVEHAHQVDIEHPTPIVERNIVDTASASDACIIANQMNISECCVSCVRSLLNAAGFGYVA